MRYRGRRCQGRQDLNPRFSQSPNPSRQRSCSLTQDYTAMIELVETLQALPTCDVAEQHNICFHYTFALNR